MMATVALCMLSTLSFCLSLRWTMLAARSVKKPIYGRPVGYSPRAWRMARGYMTFAFAALSLLSLLGAVKSYVELFS